MGEQIRKSDMSGVLVLLVFAVFMVSVLFVLLTGADVVQELTQRDQDSFDRRTAAQYVATRVRQADSSGMVSVREFGDGTALVLSEEIDETIYETIVYCYDGYLRELFMEEGLSMDPEFGEKILPMKAFAVTDFGTYLQVDLELTDVETETVILKLRSEREVAYEK